MATMETVNLVEAISEAAGAVTAVGLALLMIYGGLHALRQLREVLGGGDPTFRNMSPAQRRAMHARMAAESRSSSGIQDPIEFDLEQAAISSSLEDVSDQTLWKMRETLTAERDTQMEPMMIDGKEEMVFKAGANFEAADRLHEVENEIERRTHGF